MLLLAIEMELPTNEVGRGLFEWMRNTLRQGQKRFLTKDIIICAEKYTISPSIELVWNVKE